MVRCVLNGASVRGRRGYRNGKTCGMLHHIDPERTFSGYHLMDGCPADIDLPFNPLETHLLQVLFCFSKSLGISATCFVV